MKAITLTQPWATLVALGEKKIETRGWACDYRGPLAIHAAKSYRKREFADLTHREPFYSALRPSGIYSYPELDCGNVLAVTWIVDCRRTEMMTAISNKERAFGDYNFGRWALILGEVARIKPISAKGSLGLWEWKCDPLVDEILRKIQPPETMEYEPK